MTQFDYVDLIDIAGGYPPESDGQLKSDYQYDTNGNRRIGVKEDGVVTRQWIYQDQLNPVAELDGAGNLVSEFVYAAKTNVPSGIVRHDDPAAGQTTTYQVLSDHLGSVRLVAKIDGATATVVEEIDYDEFGGIGFAPIFQPFGFGGGLSTDSSSLVRFGVRDYDASVGRWLAKDPLRLGAGSSNLYGFVGGDPINKVDISGLFSLTAVGVGAGIGAVSGLAQGLNNGESGFRLIAAAAGGAGGGAIAGAVGALTVGQSVFGLGLSGLLAGPSGSVTGQFITNSLNGDPSLCGLDSGVLLNSAIFGLVGGLTGGAFGALGADTATQIIVSSVFASLELVGNEMASPDPLTGSCPSRP